MVCGLISVAKRIVSSMVSLVSPGRPRMKVPWMVMPRSWQSLVKRRLREGVEFFHFLRERRELAS